MSETSTALYAAFAAAQAEFPTIERNKTVRVRPKGGGEYTFSYADLGTILAAVRPVLAKHGLAVSQQLLETIGGKPAIRTAITHKDGGEIAGTFPLPEVPASPQQLGSLLTYLRRYTLVATLGIATEDDDDAGQASPSQFQAPKQREDGYAEQREERTLTEPQRKAIMAIRSKLIKANLLDEETFDAQLADDYGASVSGLTRSQASDLIDRLKKAESKLEEQGPLVAAEQGTADEDIPF